MNNTIIITGGNISENILRKQMKDINFQTVIAVDKGLEILKKLQIIPDHIIGDFDSVNENVLREFLNTGAEIHKLQPEKDFTDTHMALKLAIELKSDNIVILGAVGTRLDHTFANIHILKEALDKKIKAKIINENNEIELINSNAEIVKNNEYTYISLIPLTTNVIGVTLKGMKYSLYRETLRIGESIGISNEQVDDKAHIELEKGILIVIKSRD